VVNGIEKIIRLLVLPKRNYCIALKRSANAKRGPSYSDKAVAMRCVRADMTSMTLRVHYLNDGRATVAFTLRKREYFIPVALLLRVRSLDGAHTVLLGYWPLRYGEVVSESGRGSSELGEGVESERGMWTSLLHSAAPPRDARVSAAGCAEEQPTRVFGCHQLQARTVSLPLSPTVSLGWGFLHRRWWRRRTGRCTTASWGCRSRGRTQPARTARGRWG
jgi:hypothetical protein